MDTRARSPGQTSCNRRHRHHHALPRP